MDIVFYLFLLCVVLWHLRHMNNKYQATKFVYRMSELRTRLSVLADTGVIRKDNMYAYLDDTFKMLIDQHRHLNLYTISYFSFLSKSDKTSREDGQVLKNYCESHPELGVLYNDYRAAIYKYLRGQHKIVHTIFSSVSIFVSTYSNRFKALNTNLIEGLLAYSETSRFRPNRFK